MSEKMTPEDLKWRAREDARSLARAEEIKADKERLTLARVHAHELLNEESERMSGLKKVAGQGNRLDFISKSDNPATIKKF